MISHCVGEQRYILRYYDTEYGRIMALVALDSWRTDGRLNFAIQDMDAMANAIYAEPV